MGQDFLPVLREYVLYIESMKVRAMRTLSPVTTCMRQESTPLTGRASVCQQNVLRKRDQTQAEYEGRLEAAVLRRQEERTPVRQRRLYAILMNFSFLRTFILL